MLNNAVILTGEDLSTLIQAAVDAAMAKRLNGAPSQGPTDNVLIDRSELVRRLSVTEQTIIRYEKKGRIPCYRVGGAPRYDWEQVKKALQYKA